MRIIDLIEQLQNYHLYDEVVFVAYGNDFLVKEMELDCLSENNQTGRLEIDLSNIKFIYGR